MKQKKQDGKESMLKEMECKTNTKHNETTYLYHFVVSLEFEIQI